MNACKIVSKFAASFIIYLTRLLVLTALLFSLSLLYSAAGCNPFALSIIADYFPQVSPSLLIPLLHSFSLYSRSYAVQLLVYTIGVYTLATV